MGGEQSTPPPEPTLNDRVFILIGKAKAGKSNLGNLLLGRNQFETSESRNCVSKTTSVQSSEITLSPGMVFGRNYNEDNFLKIKVIDQPGMDDANIEPKAHCDNLVKCMSDVNVKTFPTFLLVIKLESDQFLDDNCLLLTLLSHLLTQASYNLFSHAVVVFTHTDKLCDDIINKDRLMQIVTGKCRQVGWRGLTEVLEAVNQRCIFVNGTNTEGRYRNELLRDLFEISKHILHIRLHGNTNFPSANLKHKLGIEKDGIVEEELYLLDYQFHPDINLFWKEKERDSNISEQFIEALHSIAALGEGVSSMAVLISLFTPFSRQMEELIYQLPTYYMPAGTGDPHLPVQQWWSYVFIVFEVSDDLSGEATVKENLALNKKMQILADKVNNRWTWIAKNTSQCECRDRITEMCLRVRKEIGGKVFIKDTVVRELRAMTKQIDDRRENAPAAKIDPTFQEKMAQGLIYFTESNNTLVTKFWGIKLKHQISVHSMRLILRNTLLSGEEIKRFREEYKDPEVKVSIEEVIDFLAHKEASL